MRIIEGYFALCIIAWVIDIIVVAAIAVIKPLRMWCWKKYRNLCNEIMSIFEEEK